MRWMSHFFQSSLRIFIGLNLHLTLILAAGRSPASICCLRLLISWANTFLSSSRSLRWRRASSVLTITSTSFRSQVCKYDGHQSVESTELAGMHKQSVQCRLPLWTNFTLTTGPIWVLVTTEKQSFITLTLAAAPSIPLFWTSLRFSATSLLFCRASFSRLLAAAACEEKV